MGCINSKPSAASGSAAKYEVKDEPKPAGKANIGAYVPKRPKLDPKDFQFVGLTGGVHVKAPGAINGQAFVIDKCENADLYIVDHCGQVTIDECKGCRIFIGPTDGSVFIRDSSACKVAVVTRQLRLRDCRALDISLFCRTRPIVESSTDIGFGCYDFNYPALTDQLAKAKLHVLHNFWSFIYDFTPKSGNWKFLPEATTVQGLLGQEGKLPAEAASAFGPGAGGEGPLLKTFGDRMPLPSPEFFFVAFPDRKLDHALQFLETAAKKCILVRTNRAVVSPEVAAQMAQLAGWSRGMERDLSTGQPIAFEFSGEGCVTTLRPTVQQLGGHYSESEEVARLFRPLGIDG